MMCKVRESRSENRPTDAYHSDQLFTMIPASSQPSSASNLDLSIIKAQAQRNLFQLLDKFEGSKAIVWDDKLIGPFEFVASGPLLKQHDVTKLFRLTDIRHAIANTNDYTLYFLRKDYQVAKTVAEALNRAERLTLAKTVLVFVPQRCASLEKFLEVNKLDMDKLHSIEELRIELFVLDSDILSMENDSVYRDLHVYEDQSSIHQIVEGLIALQDVFGQIPRITGQGKAAKLVSNLLLNKRKFQSKSETTSNFQIHQLVLIDRRIDLVTPFLTQLTYEGLLDEVFGINHGTITLPSDRFKPPDDKNKKQEPEPKPEKTKETKRFELRSTEELYSKLRDCHINAVADTLKQSARSLQAEYEECNSEGKTIHEMSKIVKRLSHLKMAKSSQSTHVTIAELVNEQTLKPEFIYGLRIEHQILQEDGVSRIIPDIDLKLLRQEPPLHVLRLICLQSIVNNGLKSKICNQYMHEVIQNYGDDYLLFMMQLERAHVLLSHERFHETGYFSQLKSKFNLINDNVDECNPNHMSYVYGGYTPMSVVVAKILAQFSQGPHWRLQSENLKLLPEPTVTYSSISSSGNSQATTPLSTGSLTSGAMFAASMLSEATGLRVRRNSATSSQSSGEEPRTVLVFFIGGCTFAEISALRFLSQQEENNCEFIIGTTKIINGRTFLKSLWPMGVTSRTVAASA